LPGVLLLRTFMREIALASAGAFFCARLLPRKA
jgi:hypothetical protein